MNKIMDMKVTSKYVDILGAKIHYLEQGQGDPILFLHGIPTSSHLWRNIIPHLSPLGRCIAPDLIGFGRSAKPDIAYTIFDHIRYINEFIKVLNLQRLVIVMHGWGSVIGCDYATRNESNCKGLVFYESFLRAFASDDISLPYQEQISMFEDQENTYDLVVNGTAFVDRIMPQNIMRQLSEEEMKIYRQPFTENGSAKPIMQYLKELPRGSNSEVDRLISSYSIKLMQSKLPKLLLYSVPGFITTMSTVMWAKTHLPKLEIVDVGEELHLAQETNPDLIGETISVWLQGIEQSH